jgi:hypothetical protein
MSAKSLCLCLADEVDKGITESQDLSKLDWQIHEVIAAREAFVINQLSQL